jgi:hypothetical protein
MTGEAIPIRRLGRTLLFAGLPCLFWFGFFANPALVPDTPEAHVPVGFVHWDVYRLYYPSLHGYFGMLRDGTLPLWDPYRAAGFPAVGSYLFGVFYPLNAPFLLWTVPTALAISALLHFMLALYGMHRFLRGVKLARPAALLGAVVYAFSGFLVYSLWHPSLFNVVATVPLLFAVGDRWARKGGIHRAALLGACVGLQGLGGYLQGTVYALYLLAPFLLFRIITRHGTSALLKRWTPAGLAAGLIAAGIVALVALPTAELSRLSIRKPGGLTLEETQPVGALPAADYLTALLDPRNPLPGKGDGKIKVGEYYFRGFPYFGIVALLLVLMAPIVSRKRSLVIFFGAAMVIATVLALGSSTFLFPLVHRWVPTADWFRFPRRFLMLTALAAAVLAGLAVDGLVRAPPAPADRLDRRHLLALVMAALIPLAASLWLARAGLLPPERLRLGVFLVLAAVTGCLALARARGPTGRRLVLVLLALLLTVDAFMHNLNRVLHPSADPAPFSRLTEGRQFLRRHAGLDRVYLQRFGGKLQNHLPAKIGLLDGYLTCMDYEALTLERYERYTNLLSRGTTQISLGFAGNRPIHLTEASYRNSRLFDYLGVKLLAVEKGTRRELELENLPAKKGPGLLLRRVFTGDVMAIFENPHSIPRVRFVPAYRVEPTPDRALKALLDPELDPLQTVVLESVPLPGLRVEPRPAAGADVRVAIETYEPNRVVIEAVTPSAGFIVLTDQFYPGWQAEVNGRERPVLPADYLFRAVPVEAGKCRVVFRFVPRSFWMGAAAAVFSGLACAFLVWMGRRRERRARRGGGTGSEPSRGAGRNPQRDRWPQPKKGG